MGMVYINKSSDHVCFLIQRACRSREVYVVIMMMTCILTAFVYLIPVFLKRRIYKCSLPARRSKQTLVTLFII